MITVFAILGATAVVACILCGAVGLCLWADRKHLERTRSHEERDVVGERLASLKRVYATTDMSLEEFEEQVAQVLSGVQPVVHASAAFSVNPYRVVGQPPDIAWHPGSGGHSHGTVSLYAACGTAIYYPPCDLRPQAARPSPMRASRAPF